MLRALTLVVGMMVSVNAMADGFLSGNVFEKANLSGSINITCGSLTAFELCSKQILLPSETDHFVSDSDLHAKFVRLTVGTKVVTARYFQAKQRTKDEITLLATSGGILSDGLNNVQVEFLNAQEQVVQTTSFQVTVANGTPRTCNTRNVTSTTLSDCQNGGGQRLCNTYFENENFCSY